MASALGTDDKAAVVADEKPAAVAGAVKEAVVGLIPPDLEKRKISPRTKKLALEKLAAAAVVAVDEPVSVAVEDSVSAEVAVVEEGAQAVEEGEKAAAVVEEGQTSPAPVTAPSDLEKRQRRAERFGLEIHMSESEKRSIRAARFGGTSTAAGLDDGSIKSSSPVCKEMESEKRKARAARFGIKDAKDGGEGKDAQQGKEKDDDKKKARAARFGLVKSDAAEVEKRKARAERFASTVTANSSKKPRVTNVGTVGSA